MPEEDDARAETGKKASAGHKIGQLVGDWFEEFFVPPIVGEIAAALGLYMDSRFNARPARGEKLAWPDAEGNSVDYDFVLELGGTKKKKGYPVAFIESFWRRGARHSKDKARDDTGKLVPMREHYPTARFLGLIAAGEFTAPARELVRTREVNLLYVPKALVLASFEKCQIVVDYPDTASEAEKAALLPPLEAALTVQTKQKVARTLRKLSGESAISSYISAVRAQLSAPPQEIRIVPIHISEPIIFRNLADAARYLNSKPDCTMCNPTQAYVYEITYADGTEFRRDDLTNLNAVEELNTQMMALGEHMAKLVSGEVVR